MLLVSFLEELKLSSQLPDHVHDILTFDKFELIFIVAVAFLLFLRPVHTFSEQPSFGSQKFTCGNELILIAPVRKCFYKLNRIALLIFWLLVIRLSDCPLSEKLVEGCSALRGGS